MKEEKSAFALKASVIGLCLCFSGCATTPGGTLGSEWDRAKAGTERGVSAIGKDLKDTFDNDNPCEHSKRNVGIALGALAGLVIGNQFHHSTGARLIGAAAGATVGGMIGNGLDKRDCEIWKIAQKHGLAVSFKPIEVKASASSGAVAGSEKIGADVAFTDKGGQFAPGSAKLTLAAKEYFAEVADQYSYSKQKAALPAGATKEQAAYVESLKNKKIMLVGNTDDVGNTKKNAALSEARAKAVAKVFEAEGVPSSNLYFQGAGEAYPIADNHTSEGRAKNRRVEIVDVRSDADLKGYLANRAPNVKFYRMKKPVERQVESSKSEEAKSSKGEANAGVSAKSRSESSIGISAKGTRAGRKFVDFGGSPASPKAVDIGSTADSSFSFISSANAADVAIPACMNDRYRASRGVKSLASGEVFDTSDYANGMYGGSWVSMANGNMVALSDVKVLRDGGLPASRPRLSIYKNYKGNVKQRPTFSSLMDVNAYKGDKGVLYRVFGKSGDPLSCFDLVVPNASSARRADGSNIYYMDGATTYDAETSPVLANNYGRGR